MYTHETQIVGRWRSSQRSEPLSRGAARHAMAVHGCGPRERPDLLTSAARGLDMAGSGRRSEAWVILSLFTVFIIVVVEVAVGGQLDQRRHARKWLETAIEGGSTLSWFYWQTGMTACKFMKYIVHGSKNHNEEPCRERFR